MTTLPHPKPIHPFPARMAPEIALEAIGEVGKRATVLDPMCGSGTVPRIAAQMGRAAIGSDLDPLAVLIASVWASTKQTNGQLEKTAADFAERASMLRDGPHLPWIDEDDETRRFVDFWFAPRQQDELRRLSMLLAEAPTELRLPLSVALSRTIVTKDHGASLGRDISHSRPHRVRLKNDYDVYAGFVSAARLIAERLEAEPFVRPAQILHSDARDMKHIADHSVDLIVTSPPYLNAIDYMRGHRLSLVWLGWRLSETRAIRGKAVGAEKAPGADYDEDAVTAWIGSSTNVQGLASRERLMLYRYAIDLDRLAFEAARVTKHSSGKAVLVVGNTTTRGVFVNNAEIAQRAFERAGFRLVNVAERALPARSRYLPPPTDRDGNANLNRRMRTEVVLTLSRCRHDPATRADRNGR